MVLIPHFGGLVISCVAHPWGLGFFVVPAGRAGRNRQGADLGIVTVLGGLTVAPTGRAVAPIVAVDPYAPDDFTRRHPGYSVVSGIAQFADGRYRPGVAIYPVVV